MKTLFILLVTVSLTIGLASQTTSGKLTHCKKNVPDSAKSGIEYGTVFPAATPITFDQFKVLLNEVDISHKMGVAPAIYAEDVHFDLENRPRIEGKDMSVVSDLNHVQVKMRYETSITIQGLDRDCDLADWKHYVSDWTELEESSPQVFKAPIYTFKQTDMFPEVTFQEITAALKNRCDRWEEYAKSTLSKKFPGMIGISKYYIEFSGQDNQGETVTRTVSLSLPMDRLGC